MTIKEIEEKLDQERAQLEQLELNHVVSPLENPMKIRDTRRKAKHRHDLADQAAPHADGCGQAQHGEKNVIEYRHRRWISAAGGRPGARPP